MERQREDETTHREHTLDGRAGGGGAGVCRAGGGGAGVGGAGGVGLECLHGI